MARTPDDDSFLNRWSQRKRAARVEEETPTQPEETAEEAPQQGESTGPEPITEEELAALPSIDELTPETDIRAFLRPGVPAALKNAALRKMWMLTPSIRDHVDPAVDYAWDWNTPGGVPGDGAAPAREVMKRMLDEFRAPRGSGRDTEVRGAAPATAAGWPAEPKERQGNAERVDVAQSTVEADVEADTDACADGEARPDRRPRHGGAVPG